MNVYLLVFISMCVCVCVCVCRQLDSLRYLITVLLDKGQANILCGLSFRQLEPDAGRLLEMRARGADLLTTNTYPTLFSYCILRKNYRKGDPPRPLVIAGRHITLSLCCLRSGSHV